MMPHPRPSWPRRLRRLCLFLLLGLGTTVGVAWGLALRIPLDSGLQQSRFFRGDFQHHPRSCPLMVSFHALGSVRRGWDEWSMTGPTVIDGLRKYARSASQMQPWLSWTIGNSDRWGGLEQAMQNYDENHIASSGLEDARGAPALALWFRVTNAQELTNDTNAIPRLDGGLLLPTPDGSYTPLTFRALPLLPIWPGLAFNTLFYALLWWLALASVRMVKHNRRYRHGLCPLCRYDLRADYSQGCSECGWKR